MKVVINYSELADYIESHHKVRLNISYVDGKTINVSYQVARFLPSVSVNIHIENATNEMLLFSYDSSSATQLLIKTGVKFLKEQLEEKYLTVDDERNCILLHIANIEPIQEAFEYVSLSDIIFEQDAIEITVILK